MNCAKAAKKSAKVIAKVAATGKVGAGAAYSGAAIAQTGIAGVRAVAPSLRTDAKTEKIEKDVFSNVGGGAAGGATTGALIGSIGGPAGAAAGAAIGGALGAAAGAVRYATG